MYRVVAATSLRSSRRSLLQQRGFGSTLPRAAAEKDASKKKDQLTTGKLVEFIAKEHDLKNTEAKKIVTSVFDHMADVRRSY